MSRPIVARIAIVPLMALGSVAMWLVNPVAWIWGVSQLADSAQARMSHVLVILGGIASTMAVFGRGLVALDRAYGRMCGTPPPPPTVAAWRRSLRAERDSSRPPTVLERVMVWSVVLAVLTMGVWFLFFARGGGLPPA